MPCTYGPAVQDGEDSFIGCLKSQLIFAKEPLIIELFGGK